ncbi:transcriptional regulator GutM [Alkalihalobacillus sp. TS-13]|uniref:transcriptional regulator GutM n=1 Tax=Alkalihalobacillus sp. TS-13 TaxID=2842455 RepID=UPI001C86768D|nr:transcriptional regulator GutM [Alkalihalobacillus sp. TS-13]
MNFAIIMCAILVSHFALSLFQIHYYRKSVDKIVSGYKKKEGYHLFSGMERRKFRPGAIAVLIVDEKYIVQECQILGGISVLSKFKEIKKYKGIHVGKLLDNVHKDNIPSGKAKKASAINQALSRASENALLSISKKKISSI